jgi:uncharacterized protein (TIGR02145 family)
MLVRIFIAALLLHSFDAVAQETGTFRDPRDGEIYRWVKIGNQVWMAENLRFSAGRSSGYYDLRLNGRFYDWDAARKSCPPGWHLPSDEEWMELEKTLGMDDTDLEQTGRRESGKTGLKLKASSGWRFYMQNGNGSDARGFTALPGGYFHGHTRKFMYYGSGITFWTSTSYDSENAIARELGSQYDGVDRGTWYKVHGCYVRAVKD